eukprot:3339720-Pleurochrysis_carterae.AAC.2
MSRPSSAPLRRERKQREFAAAVLRANERQWTDVWCTEGGKNCLQPNQEKKFGECERLWLSPRMKCRQLSIVDAYNEATRTGLAYLHADRAG